MHGKGNQNGKFFTPVQGTMYAIIFLAQWVAAAAQAANGVAETMISLPLSQMKTTKFFP